MAGELEIILDKGIDKIEKQTRLQVLRTLAYKHEYLSREEVLNQYASFVCKMEKGKFRWGSNRDLEKFEQQLVYNISIDSRKREKRTPNRRSKGRKDDRKRYC